MSELSGYSESGKKVAVGVKKVKDEKNGAIKLLLYYYKNGEWIPFTG